MAFINSCNGVSLVRIESHGSFTQAAGRPSSKTSCTQQVNQDQQVYMKAGPQFSRRVALSMIPAVATLFLRSTESRADHTLVAARRSFDRYHPRMLTSIATILQIKGCVTKGDAQGATALVNDKIFSIKGRRAFSIYATSFSDNYLGGQSRAMLKAINSMYDELDLVAAGDDMTEHFNAAVENLELYYGAARLPKSELSPLR